MPDTINDTALDRARRALLRDGVIRLGMLADLANARLDFIAVTGREPIGWHLLDGDRIHWSSYGEAHHPAVILKLLITRLGAAMIPFDYNPATNVLRLKFRPDPEA